MPLRNRRPTDRWAVARETSYGDFGYAVLTWTRWRWQARRAARSATLLSRSGFTYFVASKAEVDESWKRFDQRMDERKEMREN